MDTITKFITPGIIFLLTLVFGVWLSSLGKPYNGILFNIHKLIALGTVIVTAMQVSKLLKGAEVQSLIILIVAVGLCVIALFFTGAMMSVGKLDYKVMLTIHRVMPFLVVATMALTIYLLIGKYHEI